jgi:DNA replication protein DnaC
MHVLLHTRENIVFILLYLYGKPGMGKTYIVQRVFGELNFRTLYMPVILTAELMTVLFEEFEYETYRSNFFQSPPATD